MLQKHKLTLASQSPRRIQLLKEAGYNFNTYILDIDESYPPTLNPIDVAQFIAEKKAHEAFSILQNDNHILITADTVVIYKGVILEKPKDKKQAISFLELLSNNTHQVVTGVCLQSINNKVAFYDTAYVSFDFITLSEIKFYVDNYQPYDKAGAYGIQEWIGHAKITKIEGTYPTIMGLPVHLIYKELNRF